MAPFTRLVVVPEKENERFVTLFVTVMLLPAVPAVFALIVTWPLVGEFAVAVTAIVPLLVLIAFARFVASVARVALVCQFSPVFVVALEVKVTELAPLVMTSVSPFPGVPVNVPTVKAATAVVDPARLVLYTTKSGCAAPAQLAVPTSKEYFAG